MTDAAIHGRSRPRLLSPQSRVVPVAVVVGAILVLWYVRLQRRCRTAAHYRLFALPGGPPARPGLVRAENGRAIEVEVWELPVALFGGFVAGVPGPLGIGTLELEDGEEVTWGDGEAAVVSPLRRKCACLDGAPDVDFARSGPFHRFLQAQNCHPDLSHRRSREGFAPHS